MQALYQLDVQGSDLLERLGEFFIENEADDLARKLPRLLMASLMLSLKK